MIYPEEKDIVLSRLQGTSYAAIKREHGYDSRLVAEIATVWELSVDVPKAVMETNRRHGKEREVEEWYICQYCKEPYKRKKHRHGDEGKQYCSRMCGWKGIKGAHRKGWEEKQKKKEMMSGMWSRIYIKKCKWCRKLFVARRSYMKYCSQECSNCMQGWRHINITDYRPLYSYTCVICGKTFEGRAGGILYCSNRCSGWVSKERRKARLRDVYIEDVLFETVYKRDKGRCQICGRRVHKRYNRHDKLSGTRDHMIAVDNGGEHSYRNVQLACLYCNSKKGNRKTWLQMELI